MLQILAEIQFNAVKNHKNSKTQGFIQCKYRGRLSTVESVTQDQDSSSFTFVLVIKNKNTNIRRQSKFTVLYTVI